MKNNGLAHKTPRSGKKLFLFLGLFILTAAAILFLPLEKANNKKNKTVTSAPPKTKEEVFQNLNRDSDGDGLKDWEEKIYETDANNPDTDGDGTGDGDEIKSSRNPLKSGPDDALSLPLPPAENKNLTESVANEFINRSLTRVVAESIAGVQPLSDLSQDPDFQSYLEKLSQERPLSKVIPPENRSFTVIGDNSTEAVKKYFNTIADINIKNFSNIDSDISILYLAAQGSNPKAFRRLDANINAISKAIEEIKNTPTPSKWLNFAKNEVWYLSKVLAAVKILRNSENDPISSLLILQDRVELLDEMRNFYIETRIKLEAAGIVFGNDEPAAKLLLQ